MSVNEKSDQIKETKDTKDSKDIKDEPADFETAMHEAGFGIFNLMLIILAIPATCGTVFETTTMSYILPIAECDLKLTLIDKGILNAATYAGMIVSAIIWGYLADTQGRKKILVFGYMLDAICVLCSSMSQNLEMLVVFKFLGGFSVNGPGAVLFTYLSELHGIKHRPRVLMVLGMITSMATLFLPLMAWAIFPRDWNFTLFNSLKMHSWNVYLALCALPSLISSLGFSFLPESPKFLMSQGRNAEALYSLKKIYAINKRKPKDTFPIHQLIEEVPARDGNANEVVFTIENTPKKPKFQRQHRTFLEALREGMTQIKPMFRKPLLGHSLHIYTMQFCILLGLNTIRLWLPQLFASIAEYEALATSDEGGSNMCTILEYSVNKTGSSKVDFATTCMNRPPVSMSLYTNNIIVALTGLAGYFVASAIVRLIGGKRLLTYGLLISGCLGAGLYWSVSGLSTLIISSAFVTVASISTTSLIGVVVAIFPTSLRTLIISIGMMFGRLGALSGNMLFPIFVEIGCIPPFIMVASVLLCASALSCILPSPKKAVFT